MLDWKNRVVSADVSIKDLQKDANLLLKRLSTPAADSTPSSGILSTQNPTSTLAQDILKTLYLSEIVLPDI